MTENEQLGQIMVMDDLFETGHFVLMDRVGRKRTFNIDFQMFDHQWITEMKYGWTIR